MKQEVLLDGTESLTFTPPPIDNRPAVASSATVILKKPGGDSLQVSVAVTTINATTGKLSYTLTTTHTATLGENYIAEWSYVISSVTYKETTLFDIVKHRLSQLTTDEDLYSLQGDLRARHENVQGTVGSATSTTVVDTDVLKNYPDDYFNNGIIEVVLPSTGARQRRTVSDFANSTGTVTVSTAFATTPTSSYKYTVYKPFRVKLDYAWDMVMNDVRSKGFRPALIMNSADLKHIHSFKTLELICMDFLKEKDDTWDMLRALYQEKYNDAFGKILFQYDDDESGSIGGSEEDQTPARLKMVR